MSQGKYLTILIHPDSPTHRQGVWSDDSGDEFESGVIRYRSGMDSFVIRKFSEQGYKINIFIDRVPLK
jgi:hypothetical protein